MCTGGSRRETAVAGRARGRTGRVFAGCRARMQLKSVADPERCRARSGVKRAAANGKQGWIIIIIYTTVVECEEKK